MLHYRQKERLLQDILQELGSKIRGDKVNQFNVVRGHLLDGAIRGLQRKSFNSLNPISVKFMDDIGVSEGAVDQGGPKREFFTFVMQELFNTSIFAGPESQKMLIPSHNGIIVYFDRNI